MTKVKIVIFILFTFYVLRFTYYVNAQHFSSTNYIIDFGNFNITSGKKSSVNYSLTDTVGQIAPGTYTSTGFKLKGGFQSIYDTFNQFSFSINNLNIALGTLVPQVGSTASNIISVSTPSGHGYDIYVQENHPLAQGSGQTIPDVVAGNWTLSTTYGFGFNVTGINNTAPLTYFSSPNYYRPFSTSPLTQIIMSESTRTYNPNSIHTATVTYKANISSAQAAGNYQNAIIFTAVPKY